MSDEEQPPLRGISGRKIKVGVSTDGARGGYQVYWVDPLTGMRRSTRRITESEARKYAAEVETMLRARVAAHVAEQPEQPPTIATKGSPREASYWAELLGEWARRISARPNDETLQRASKAVAALAAAARSYIDVAESEAQLKELEETITALRRGEKYGLAHTFAESAPTSSQ